MKKDITIAIVGAPNTGKTTVFNRISGADGRVANFPGVTVNVKEGRARFGDKVLSIVDLPGTYGLASYSEDEILTRRFLLEREPDAVLDIVDAEHLERNLYLTVQLLEMGVPVVVCLNMIDRADDAGISIEADEIARLLDVKVIPMIARRGKGIDLLKKALEEESGIPFVKPLVIDYGTQINAEIDRIADVLRRDESHSASRCARWTATKLLERDEDTEASLSAHAALDELMDVLAEARKKLASVFDEEYEIELAQRRYKYIEELAERVMKRSTGGKRTITDKLDRFLTRSRFGIPFFLAVMWLLFSVVFSLASPINDAIELLLGYSSSLLAGRLGGGMIESLAIDGVIGGVGAVIIFVPSIFLLFAGIAILEDSGYLSRAAFIMERAMSKLGLPGKAFVPLILGFGCNVPAIMATRVLENRRDRTLAILVIPLISCSAKLPVYVLLIGAFFPAEYAGTILFGVYMLSGISALLITGLLRSSVLKGPSAPMILELPPYNTPTLRGILMHAWGNARHYLRKAFTFIFVGSILLWFAVNYPVTVGQAEIDRNIVETRAKYGEIIASADASEAELLFSEMETEIEDVGRGARQANIEGSFAGRIGRAIEPALRPLGFDWRVGVGLISGVLAKEIVVSTLGVIFNVEDIEGEDASLREALRKSTLPDGSRAFLPLSAFSLILFVMLYIPCIATLAVQRSELKNIKWFLVAMIYPIALAYIVSLVVYQVGSMLGFGT